MPGLNDSAVFSVGTAHFYTAVAGTAAPTTSATLLAPPVAWTEVGHTSLEDILAFASEGGDATVLGTLQKKTLRTTYSNRTETMAFVLQQFDVDSIKLYFGSNAAVIAANSPFYGVPANPTPTSRAFLAVFQDGTNVFPLYAPQSELFRGDDLSLSDTESLAGLPIQVKPIPYQSNTWAYAVAPIGSITA